MTADCIDTPLPQHYTWSDLSVNLGSDLRPEHLGHLGLPFLASQDALEVTLVTDLLTDSLDVSIDLTDATLVGDDT